MQNEPGFGPTRSDKTAERMAQERQSPGATSAGGHSADAVDNDTGPGHRSAELGGPSTTSANTSARRGDVAAARSTEAATHALANGREERIRAAAYRLFQSRNESNGDALTDWLLAEAVVDAALHEHDTPDAATP